MIRLPEELIHSLENLPGFDRDRFLQAHEQGKPLPVIRINPAKLSKVTNLEENTWSPLTRALNLMDRVPWCPDGYYLDARPSFTWDPLFHAGAYYVQEPSSMLIDWVIRQVEKQPGAMKVLDLCAAPGGKTTLLQSILPGNCLLVANETIKSRVSRLETNLIKWGNLNYLVTNRDPSAFKPVRGFFDIILVDAPCSGSGLFRKDPKAIAEWSPELVDLCSRRQQRILTEIIPSLQPEGLLIYSTCSYSPKENEEIATWMVNHFPLESVEIQVDPGWGLVPAGDDYPAVKGWRCFPYLVRGEGFFVTCLRKTGGEQPVLPKPQKKSQGIKNMEDVLDPWILGREKIQIISENENLLALPQFMVQDANLIQDLVGVRQMGISLGKLIRDEFIPDPTLALSSILNPEVPSIDLDLEGALKYLSKGKLNLDTTTLGWVLVKYNGLGLGWAKILSNRVNNYYPASWRIMKGE